MTTSLREELSGFFRASERKNAVAEGQSPGRQLIGIEHTDAQRRPGQVAEGQSPGRQLIGIEHTDAQRRPGQVAEGQSPGRQLIGIEHEKVSFKKSDGSFVPYAGRNGILHFLQEMCTRFGWEPVYTEGYLLSLTRGRAQITLEPGGQIELSGTPHDSLVAVGAELKQHFEEVTEVGDALGIGIAGIGLHPGRNPFDIPFIPKPRYSVMRRYFQTSGTRGLYMMGATATVQVNLDFASEEEALEKMRAGQLASPFVSALLGNSPFEHGENTGWQSRRYYTWTDVDKTRQGLLPFVHAGDNLYERYTEWALRAPLFGIHRGHHEFIAAPPIPFGQFVDTGFGQQTAVMDDWFDHLGTLYPEVRLKKTIELRGQDSGGWGHSMAVAGLWRGLLDHPGARRRVIQLLTVPADAVAWQLKIAQHGLKARPDVIELCRELLVLAGQGLHALGELSGSSSLAYAWSALETATSPADSLVRVFGKSGKINPLEVLNGTRVLPVK